MMALPEWSIIRTLISKLNKGANKLVVSEVSLNKDAICTDKNVIFNDTTDRYFLDQNGDFTLSFGKVAMLNFINSKIVSFGSKEQRIRNTLRFDRCKYLRTVNMSNVDFFDDGLPHSVKLIIDECYKLTEINNIRSSQIGLNIVFNQCGLSRIHFAQYNQNVHSLKLYRQKDFTDLSQIVNGDIFTLQISECAFSRFTHHNASNVSRCIFDCSNIVSFRDIQNFKIDESLVLQDISTQNNMINILLNTCNMITFRGVLPVHQVSEVLSNGVAKNIVSRYAALRNRSDYIMDCVVDLLEKNCEEAAEL